MEWDAIARNWKRVGPLAAAHPAWNLTEDEVKEVNGDRKKLDVLLAKKLGITEQEARHQTQEFGLKAEADPSDAKIEKPAAAKQPAPMHPAGQPLHPTAQPSGTGHS